MLRIQVEHYIEELKDYSDSFEESNKYEKLTDINNELEEIKEINKIINLFEEHSDLHDKKFLKNIYDQNLPMKIKELNSKLKEKDEISERLREMSYYLSTLRTSILTKDKKQSISAISNFLTNKYAGLKTVIAELNDFKEKIKEADEHYRLLMRFIPNSLDHQLTTRKKYKDHRKNLLSLHAKQKEILQNVSKLFLNFSKKALRK